MATPRARKPQGQQPAEPARTQAPNVQTGGSSVDIASAVSGGINKGFDTFKDFSNAAFALAQKNKALAEDDLSSQYQLATAEVIQQMRYGGKSYANSADVIKDIDSKFFTKVGGRYEPDFLTEWRQSKKGVKTISVSNLEANGQHLIAQYNFQQQTASKKGNNLARLAFSIGDRSMIDTGYSAWLNENTALNEADKKKMIDDANRQYDLGMLERMIVTKPALIKRNLEKQLNTIRQNEQLTKKQKEQAEKEAISASYEKLAKYSQETEKQLRDNPDFLPYLTPREVENAIKTAQLMISKMNGGKEPKEDTMVDYIDALSMRLRDLQGAGYLTSKEQILKDIDEGTLPGGTVLADYVQRHGINSLEDLRGVYANNSLELLNAYGISAKDQQAQENRITNANYDNDYDFEMTRKFIQKKTMFDTSDKVRVDDETGKYFSERDARILNILDNPEEYANRIITINDDINKNQIGKGNKKAAQELQNKMLVELGRAGSVAASREQERSLLRMYANTQLRLLSAITPLDLSIDTSAGNDTWFDVASRQVAAQFEISPIGSVNGIRNEELAGRILSNVVSELKKVPGFDFKTNNIATLEVVRQYTEGLTSAALKGRSGADVDVYIDDNDNVYIQNFSGRSKKNEFEEEEYWMGSFDKQTTPAGNFRVLKDKSGNVLAVVYSGDE